MSSEVCSTVKDIYLCCGYGLCRLKLWPRHLLPMKVVGSVLSKVSVAMLLSQKEGKVMHDLFTLCSQPMAGAKDCVVRTIFICAHPLMAGVKNHIVTNMGFRLSDLLRPSDSPSRRMCNIISPLLAQPESLFNCLTLVIIGNEMEKMLNVESS